MSLEFIRSIAKKNDAFRASSSYSKAGITIILVALSYICMGTPRACILSHSLA